MSAVESALDVLSRAATMVQEERPKATSLHRKPSSVWRKERRRDPIQSEALDMTAQARAQQQQQQHHQQHNGPSRPSVIVPTTAAPKPGLQSPEATAKFLTGTTTENTAVTPTASVTPSAATRGQPDLQNSHNQQGRQSSGQHQQQQQRSGMRTAGVQASDPAIDEHFKRSLGLKDYAAVFDAVNANDKDAGLSVDDHFAKALGETWTKLQATSRSKDAT